jgi:hypothetical protein
MKEQHISTNPYFLYHWLLESSHQKKKYLSSTKATIYVFILFFPPAWQHPPTQVCNSNDPWILYLAEPETSHRIRAYKRNHTRPISPYLSLAQEATTDAWTHTNRTTNDWDIYWHNATIAVSVASPSIKNSTNIPTEELVHAIPGPKLPSHTDSMTLHTGKWNTTQTILISTQTNEHFKQTKLFPQTQWDSTQARFSTQR